MSDTSQLPRFDPIDTTHFVDKLDQQLQRDLQQIDRILKTHNVFTWENLMQPLDSMEDALEQTWSPLSHQHAVMNTPALRECYEACLPKLSTYHSTIGHNQALYDAMKSLDRRLLNATQQKILDDNLHHFELAGVALSADKKQRFEAIQQRLAELSNQFENNIVDAREAYQLTITEETQLSGLPDYILDQAKTRALDKGEEGWVLTLEAPTVNAVLNHADDRALREAIYYAHITRASDQGPSAGQFDNTSLMNEILQLSHEQANLLGFANYAELSLDTKMAGSIDDVRALLTKLCDCAYPQAELEFKALQAFANKECQLKTLEPWDIPYVSEKVRQLRYSLSQEELRPYFPLESVMQGMFSIIQTLYGMRIEALASISTWHPDVLCYRVVDSTQKLRGYIYADLFARPKKRGGAWMDSCRSRRRLPNGEVQDPIAFLTCNFAKPVAGKEATLSHDEVLTLFHEMGHCLHHVLTQVDYLGGSGMHGVEWDAVELPSQFFENWCWEQESLQRLSRHVETGAPLPLSMIEKLHTVKNFQSAMMMMRQLEFSLFDLGVYQYYDASQPNFIAEVLANVRKTTSVVPVASYNRFQHAFSHIFCGGYAAGYYSYKWAEVLSSDAFARFEEEGVFNPKTGADFLHCILESGGSKKALETYVCFRGREATVDALLRQSGISLSS